MQSLTETRNSECIFARACPRVLQSPQQLEAAALYRSNTGDKPRGKRGRQADHDNEVNHVLLYNSVGKSPPACPVYLPRWSSSSLA